MAHVQRLSIVICALQLCVGCGASSHTSDDGGADDRPAPRRDAREVLDAGSFDASSDAGTDGSSPATCGVFDGPTSEASSCSEYALSGSGPILDDIGFGLPSRSERGWQWIARRPAASHEFRLVEASRTFDEILRADRLEWLPLTLDGVEFSATTLEGSALWPTCDRWFLLLRSRSTPVRTIGIVIGAGGELVAEPLDLTPMQIGSDVVATEITGSSVNVAAARRILHGEECTSEIVVARVSSEGELLVRPTRSEIPDVSPMRLFWDRDRWALVSQSCPPSNVWTLAHLTPRGELLGTHELAMDDGARPGVTVWARGPDDALVAVFSTNDGTPALALQEVDLRSREITPMRRFLVLEDGWDVGFPFTYVTVEPGQGYALGVQMYTPTISQELWLVRTSRTGSLHSRTVLARSPALDRWHWVQPLGSSFAAYFDDGDGEAVHQLECVR